MPTCGALKLIANTGMNLRLKTHIYTKKIGLVDFAEPHGTAFFIMGKLFRLLSLCTQLGNQEESQKPKPEMKKAPPAARKGLKCANGISLEGFGLRPWNHALRYALCVSSAVEPPTRRQRQGNLGREFSPSVVSPRAKAWPEVFQKAPY